MRVDACRYYQTDCLFQSATDFAQFDETLACNAFITHRNHTICDKRYTLHFEKSFQLTSKFSSIH